MAKDIVNERVDEAQALLKQRADRLEKLVKQTENKKVSRAFYDGAVLVGNMIKGQNDLIETMVFKTPKTYLEQMRNLQLTTGGMNQRPAEYLQNFTSVVDSMLNTLEDMVR